MLATKLPVCHTHRLYDNLSVCLIQPQLVATECSACAGLSISYWVDKYIALRKAQKPIALADNVTDASNLLVRLLPLVQLILMYKLYFLVGSATSDPAYGIMVNQGTALSCHTLHVFPVS